MVSLRNKEIAKEERQKKEGGKNTKSLGSIFAMFGLVKALHWVSFPVVFHFTLFRVPMNLEVIELAKLAG